MTTTNENPPQQGGRSKGGSGKGKSRRDRYKDRIAIDPDAPGTPAPTGTEQPAATEQANAAAAEPDSGTASSGVVAEGGGEQPSSSTTAQEGTSSEATAGKHTGREEHPETPDDKGEQAEPDRGHYQAVESTGAAKQEADQAAASSDNHAVEDDPDTWQSTLDDPALVPGESDYRSFYVEDEWFGRWRAAIYWNARNPQARGVVPRNMSEGLNERFKREALEWEAQFNEGNVYPPTDDQAKAHRKRRAAGQHPKKRNRKTAP